MFLRRNKKTKIKIAVILIVISVISAQATAFVPYDSYNFITRNGFLEAVNCPAPYVPVQSYDSVSLGEKLRTPEDIFISENGDIYIADSGENKIIIADSSWTVKDVIRNFDHNGSQETLSGPEGVFVSEDGDIYIADTGNSRVVVLDSDLNTKEVLGKPKTDLFSENYVFKPAKLAVDRNKNIYIVARDEFNGIIHLDETGEFMGFLGSNAVYPSAVELFWRRVFTKQQREASILLIPLEYSNITMDDQGFMYVVTGTINERVKIKKLSPDGQNILTSNDHIYSITAFSNLSAISVDESGNFYVADGANGNISIFNRDSDMLYAFGGFGEQLGTFRVPTAVRSDGDNLYVADKLNSNVTVFQKTEYAKLINDAYSAYTSGDYEESTKLWERVLKKNGNLELAYIQLGRISYKNGDYKEAMEYFKKGNYRGASYLSGYGKAFSEYRSEYLRSNLAVILTISLAVVVLTALTVGIRRRRSKRYKNVH